MPGIAPAGTTFQTLVPPSNPGVLPRRKVLSASADTAPYTDLAAMSPSAYIGVYGTATGDIAQGEAYIGQGVSPITLSAPDIFGRPDLLGDGKNQFVYTADVPTGYLYLPGAIDVTGGYQDDAQWLVDNSAVDLKVENPTIPNVFAHQWDVQGSTINVNTPNNGYPGYRADAWVFQGLPENNSQFGNHEINEYVDGSQSEKAHIQTFFSALASNWPGTDGVTPDWYFYYNQVYASTGVYDPTSGDSYCDSQGSHDIHIRNNTYGQWNFGSGSIWSELH